MSFELPKKFRKVCFFKKYILLHLRHFSMKNISFMNDELWIQKSSELVLFNYLEYPSCLLSSPLSGCTHLEANVHITVQKKPNQNKIKSETFISFVS